MAKGKSLEVKLAAVFRVEAGETGRSVAADIGVSFGQVHRWHRAWLARGEAGLRRGALQAALTAAGQEAAAADEATVSGSVPGALPVRPLGAGAERIAALERKVAQQALELDFFATALRHVEGSSRANGQPGATASTLPSGRRRSGKAD